MDLRPTQNNEASDDQLLRAFLDGQLSAFERIHERYAGDLLGYISALLGGRKELAEDLVQETFMRLIRYGRNYKGQNRFRVFLLTIARNLVWDSLRRNVHREARRSETDPGEMLCLKAGETSKPEQDLAVEDWLGELKDEDREIVVLKVFKDLTFDEIAELTGKPVSTLATRYKLALGVLESKGKDWIS